MENANDTTKPALQAPNSSSLADAIERRLRQQQEEAVVSASGYSPFDQNHEKRQEFRRLVDPGILRRNPKHIAMESLRILVRLSDNILEHPGDPKYRKFKPTNEKVKTYLVDPKGTLEYAIALGFHPEVENFQPFYVFHMRHMNDLRTGNAIIKEILEVEEAKVQQQERARQEETAAREAAKDKVKRAFMEDRMSTAYRVQREQVVREAKAKRQASSTPPPASPMVLTRGSRISEGGHTLGDQVSPSRYSHATENDDEYDDHDGSDQD